MKGLFASILASLVILLSTSPTILLAKDENVVIEKARTLPGSFFYPFKRLLEKTRTVLTFPYSWKFKYQEDLFKERLSELNVVVEKNDINVIETTAQRLAFQAGILSGLSEKSDKYKNETKSLFERVVPNLENLRDHFPANSTYWLSIQQDIDTLGILTKELDN